MLIQNEALWRLITSGFSMFLGDFRWGHVFLDRRVGWSFLSWWFEALRPASFLTVWPAGLPSCLGPIGICGRTFLSPWMVWIWLPLPLLGSGRIVITRSCKDSIVSLPGSIIGQIGLLIRLSNLWPRTCCTRISVANTSSPCNRPVIWLPFKQVLVSSLAMSQMPRFKPPLWSSMMWLMRVSLLWLLFTPRSLLLCPLSGSVIFSPIGLSLWGFSLLPGLSRLGNCVTRPGWSCFGASWLTSGFYLRFGGLVSGCGRRTTIPCCLSFRPFLFFSGLGSSIWTSCSAVGGCRCPGRGWSRRWPAWGLLGPGFPQAVLLAALLSRIRWFRDSVCSCVLPLVCRPCGSLPRLISCA